MRAMTLVMGTVMSAGALLLVGGPALATTTEDPFNVGGTTVVDRADALSAADESRIEDASSQLFDERGTRLVVVVVDDFSGVTDDVDWANETAIVSNLPSTDVLLAISTTDDTAYWSVDQDFSVSDDKLDEIRTSTVLPALRSGDIAGAAVAFADGLSDAQAPSPVPWVVGGVIVAGVGTAIAVPAVRRRNATKRATAESKAKADELDQRASRMLVELDDALKTSEQELGFAQAQFGEASTQDFVAALASAQTTSKQAFELRQKLDDAFPETPERRRTMTEELIALAGQADATLDAQAEKFDELRQLEKNAPQVLEQVAATRAQLTDRITAAETTLAGLPGLYPQADLTSIADAPAQARKLDTFAASALEKARATIATGPESEVAVAVRAAQQAVGQIEQLLGAVDSRAAELAAQKERNASATRELGHELADATAQIAAATDYITTHRGAVGSEARTRISEAQRNADEATAAQAADPVSALASAKRAEDLARRALSLARADVDSFAAASTNGYGYSDSPSSNSYSYNDGSDGAGLGGILGDLFGGGSYGGGSSHSSGGGGWSWGGSSGGSSGGFGGSSRRSSSSGGSRRSSSGGSSRSSSGGGRRR